MTESGKSPPKSAAELRKERQAAALRANLRRRKDQARERQVGADTADVAAPTDRDAD